MTNAHEEKAREIVEKCYDPHQEGFEEEVLLYFIATALRDCERQTLERAAKVADRYHSLPGRVAESIGANIRALAQEEPGPHDKVAGEPERASNDPGKA
jgi:hypothetical protein